MGNNLIETIFIVTVKININQLFPTEDKKNKRDRILCEEETQYVHDFKREEERKDKKEDGVRGSK